MNFKEVLQGVSVWTDISKSALRSGSINNFIELWCLVASRGLGICVSSKSFQKNNIGWPQQPLTENVLKSDFGWSIWQKLVHETQISKPLEATRHHISTKLLVFLPLRAYLLCTLHYETPCSTYWKYPEFRSSNQNILNYFWVWIFQVIR